MKPQKDNSNNYDEVATKEKQSQSPKLRYKQVIKAQMEKISRLEKENADLFESTKLIAVKDKTSKCKNALVVTFVSTSKCLLVLSNLMLFLLQYQS